MTDSEARRGADQPLAPRLCAGIGPSAPRPLSGSQGAGRVSGRDSRVAGEAEADRHSASAVSLLLPARALRLGDSLPAATDPGDPRPATGRRPAAADPVMNAVIGWAHGLPEGHPQALSRERARVFPIPREHLLLLSESLARTCCSHTQSPHPLRDHQGAPRLSGRRPAAVTISPGPARRAATEPGRAGQPIRVAHPDPPSARDRGVAGGVGGGGGWSLVKSECGACLTARQELSRQIVGLASTDNSDYTAMMGAARRAHVCNFEDCASARPARPARQRWQSYKLHIDGLSPRLETSCGGIGGGPEPAKLQAIQWRLRWRTGHVARRRRRSTGAGVYRGSPQPESWAGRGRARTWRGGVCALLDWDNLPGRATRLRRLE